MGLGKGKDDNDKGASYPEPVIITWVGGSLYRFPGIDREPPYRFQGLDRGTPPTQVIMTAGYLS